jgi:hypothetical protein
MHKTLFMAVVCLASNAFAAEPAIERWARAVGGREKIAPINVIYREATISVGAYQGTIKAWHTGDGKYRKEEQIATLSTLEAFDGTNAAIQRGASGPQPMAGPELERARSTGLANWNAVFFAFFPERRKGTVRVEGEDTVVLKPDGGIEWRVMLDQDTWLPKKMVHQEGERTVTVEFGSYETIDGISFEKEIQRSNGDPRFNSTIRFTKTIINPSVDSAFFSIAPAKSTSSNVTRDPQGHWEGAVQTEHQEIRVEIDLLRNSKGEFGGTFGQPADHVKGLRLSTVRVDAGSLRFVVNGNPEPSTFDATLSDDGQTMSGTVALAGYSMPFELKRTGDPKVDSVPKSARVSKELEGTWNGTLDNGEKQLRVILSIANEPDGTASGSVRSPDGSGIAIPMAMTQSDSSVTLNVPSVGASFVGSLNAARAELVGKWTQGTFVQPVTFQRSNAETKK